MTELYPDDDWDKITQEFHRASTPSEKAWAKVRLMYWYLMTIRDTTEQLVGDPDWRSRRGT